MGLCTLLLISVTHLTSSRIGFTNPKELLPNVPFWFIFDLCTSVLCEFLTPVCNCLFAARLYSSITSLLCFNLICALFFNLFCSLNLPADLRRGLTEAYIKLSTNNLLFGFNLLTTSLLAMRSWWIFYAYTQKCFMVSVYPIKILFKVLYTFDLERFLDEKCVLTLLPNIQIYKRF